MVRQMEAATNCSAQILLFSSGDQRATHHFKKYMVGTIGSDGLQAITRVMQSNMIDAGGSGISFALFMIHTQSLTAETQTIWGSYSKSNCCEHEAR